jgi:hypothetical protein
VEEEIAIKVEVATMIVTAIKIMDRIGVRIAVADGQGKNILLRATTGRLAVAGHTGPPKESASPSPSSLSTSSSES